MMVQQRSGVEVWGRRVYMQMTCTACLFDGEHVGAFFCKCSHALFHATVVNFAVFVLVYFWVHAVGCCYKHFTCTPSHKRSDSLQPLLWSIVVIRFEGSLTECKTCVHATFTNEAFHQNCTACTEFVQELYSQYRRTVYFHIIPSLSPKLYRPGKCYCTASQYFTLQ